MNPESIAYIVDIAQIAGEVTVIIAVLFGLFELEVQKATPSHGGGGADAQLL